MKLVESSNSKRVISPHYNYIFSKEDGKFARWGETFNDDPDFSPFGPEIADIEISTICHGVGGSVCKFCYKSNVPRGKNMSLETFKQLFSKLPKTLTQIAFGIGDIDSNPDLYKIFEFCRSQGVIPNVTTNGDRLDDAHVEQLSSLCGAIAVSRYNPKSICYNAVERLTEAGMRQVNIHQLLSEETFDDCMSILDDIVLDSRLAKLNAVVFLALKSKGRGYRLTAMRSVEKYQELISKALELGVSFGFDSCSAPMFLKAIEGHKDYTKFEPMAEPCESLLFSIYIDVEGKISPCSFTTGYHSGMDKPIDILGCSNFMEDVWYHSEVKKWRSQLLLTADNSTCLVKGCRQCPVFHIYPEKLS